MNGHAVHVEEPKSVSALELKQTKLLALAGDLTPTQSRSTSPGASPISYIRQSVSSASDAGVTGADRLDPPSNQNQRSPKTNVYDTLLSTDKRRSPSRSSTPRYRPLSHLNDEMPSSSRPPAGSSSGQQRPNSSRRQQQEQEQRTRQIYTTPPVQLQQQQQQQQQAFHVAASPSESSYQTSPSISSTGGPSYARSQTQQLRSAGFVAPYTMSAPPVPTAFASQPQHQQPYAYPPMHHPGLHSHAHSAPEFYPISHSQSPAYAPAPFVPSPVHTSVLPEQAPSPGRAYEFEGAGRSPTAGSPYTPQSFSAFNFQPALTATPRFPHPHTPFAAPYQPHQQPPYQPYAYLQSPSSPEDGTVQGPVSWWIIPQPSASPTLGPYQGMYYVDAYGNPSGAGLGLGPNFSPTSLRSTPHGPARITAFPSQESGVVSGLGTGAEHGSSTGASSGIESGINPESRALQRISTGSSRPESSASSRGPLSPTPLSLNEPANDRGKQPKHGNQAQRRPYHPNPPPQRSEWVMWVGNVPNDATHDELWRFFTQQLVSDTTSGLARQTQSSLLPAGLLSPIGSSPASDANLPTTPNGVSSVFLIARSNCAFVNYSLESHLHTAIARFNGVPLRPGDPRCPRLVCRVRGQEEDLRAGVGGQRGMGMHVKWIREQKLRERVKEKERQKDEEQQKNEVQEGLGKGREAGEPPATPSSLTDNIESSSSQADSALEHNRRSPPRHSSSSGSTTSSLLTRYFPKRYFILKSLTQYDLELSVQRGLWATQPHNESILNQAYQSSTDVFLIFGVNKSGEFYGYARMAGPIEKSEERVSWASRGDSQHSHSPATSFSSAAGRSPQISETIPEERESSDEPELGGNVTERPRLTFFASEDRHAESSPKPITSQEQRNLDVLQEPMHPQVSNLSRPEGSSPTSHASVPSSAHPLTQPHDRASAPAELGIGHRRITDPQDVQVSAGSADARIVFPGVRSMELSRDARLDVVREQERRGTSDEDAVEDADRIKRKDTIVMPVVTNDGIVPSASVAPISRSGPLLPTRPYSTGPEEGVRVHQDDVAKDGSAIDGDVPAQWGTPFRVQWMRVGKLPFHNTRHLRNPWNHDREVKVSRDGTELEPSVGQLLLDEWEKNEPQRSLLPQTQTGVSGVAESPSPSIGRRGGQARRAQSRVLQAASVGEAGADDTEQFRQAPRRNRT